MAPSESANSCVAEERKMHVSMEPVTADSRERFMEMAEAHFRELNPAFIPQEDWSECYFERIVANAAFSLRWVVVDGRRCGFILFGREDHRFLPRQVGAIYELYVERQYRKQGIARACAFQAIRELQAVSPSKVQLEFMNGNTAAEKLWSSLGFRKISERWVLGEQ